MILTYDACQYTDAKMAVSIQITYSHVAYTAGISGVSLRVDQSTADAKITQFDTASSVHQYVTRLDICSDGELTGVQHMCMTVCTWTTDTLSKQK